MTKQGKAATQLSQSHQGGEKRTYTLASWPFISFFVGIPDADILLVCCLRRFSLFFGDSDFTGLYQLVYLLLRFCAPGLCLRFLGFFFEYSNCAGYLYCYASSRSSLSPLACSLGLKSAKSVRWALFLLGIMPFTCAFIATIIGGFQSK